MCKYFEVVGIKIPAYGTIVLVGIMLCNAIAIVIIKKNELDIRKFFFLELGTSICVGVCAKILSAVFVCRRSSELVTGEVDFDVGFSYFGGLAGLVMAAFLFEKVLNVDIVRYEQSLLFLIPLLHSIWKLGCFCGGCCYGIPYKGTGAIIYPEGINILSGQEVFPVQIIEAIISLSTSIFLLVKSRRKGKTQFLAEYLVIYSITRFFVEFLRFHQETRVMSDGHINSIFFLMLGLVILVIRIRNRSLYE